MLPIASSLDLRIVAAPAITHSYSPTEVNAYLFPLSRNPANCKMDKESPWTCDHMVMHVVRRVLFAGGCCVRLLAGGKRDE